jgi:hypothetical protein
MICEELYNAIEYNDVEAALYETGILLKKDKVDILLNTWVYVLCCAGRKIRTIEDAYPFSICLQHVWIMIVEDNMKVKDCFAVTTELGLLTDRLARYRFELLHLSKLKPRMQKLFPDKATLSDKGARLFQKILPPSTHESYSFAVRIAAGFTRLWEEKEWSDSRMALEYLSRRNLEVKNTCYFVHETDDILWYLWSICSMYFGKHIEKLWQVFYWNYNSKIKADRMGLLWATPLYAIASKDIEGIEVWTDEELHLIQKVREKTKDLWKQLDEALTESAKTDSNDLLDSYIPRASTEPVILPPHEDKPKQIKLGTKHSMFTMPEHDPPIIKPPKPSKNDRLPYYTLTNQ